MGSRRTRVARVRSKVDEFTGLAISVKKLTYAATGVVLALGSLTAALKILIDTLH